MPEEDRATDIGNMHKKFGKDCACGSGDILMDTQTYSSQYFVTTPTGEVTNFVQSYFSKLCIILLQQNLILREVYSTEHCNAESFVNQ